MKIIDEKGKLFGFINVFDLMVLLLVVLIGAAAVYKISGGNIKKVGTGSQKILVTVRIPSRKEPVTYAFKKGDQLMYGNLLIENAVIENVELKPSIVHVQLATGEIKPTEDPLFKDIYVTFSASIPVNAIVPKLGNTEIRVGATYVVITKNAASAGFVESIEYVK